MQVYYPDQDFDDLSDRVTKLEVTVESAQKIADTVIGLLTGDDGLQGRVEHLETKVQNMLRRLCDFWVQRFLLSDVVGCCRAWKKAIARSSQQTNRFKVCR